MGKKKTNYVSLGKFLKKFQDKIGINSLFYSGKMKDIINDGEFKISYETIFRSITSQEMIPLKVKYDIYKWIIKHTPNESFKKRLKNYTEGLMLDINSIYKSGKLAPKILTKFWDDDNDEEMIVEAHDIDEFFDYMNRLGYNEDDDWIVTCFYVTYPLCKADGKYDGKAVLLKFDPNGYLLRYNIFNDKQEYETVLQMIEKYAQSLHDHE